MNVKTFLTAPAPSTVFSDFVLSDNLWFNSFFLVEFATSPAVKRKESGRGSAIFEVVKGTDPEPLPLLQLSQLIREPRSCSWGGGGGWGWGGY